MVMLAKAIALEPGIDDAKIVLVTDRVDLDDQIYRTFRHCGTEPVQARSGRRPGRTLLDGQGRIITTIIDKFETAVRQRSASATRAPTSSSWWTRPTAASTAR